jgi:hypothetical protein
MASFVRFNQFAEDLAKGVHNFGSHTLKIALVAAANAPDAADAVLADLTEISYTNASSRDVAGVTAEQSGGVCTIAATDLVISASGGSVGPFRYAVLYNDSPTSPADPLIGYWDYGSDITLASGESFTIDWPSNLLTIGS